MFSLARIFLVYSILTCATLTKLIIEMKRTVRTSSFRIQACQILSTNRTDLANQTIIIMHQDLWF